MGIGRREFIRQFGGALATLALAPGPAAAALEDLYINRRHGLAFVKPRTWRFQDLDEVGKMQAGILLDMEDFDHDVWRELTLSDDLNRPIVVALDEDSKQFLPEARSSAVDHIAPCFEFFFEGIWDEDVRELGGGVGGLDLMWRTQLDVEMFESLYFDFRLVSDPLPTTVSECEAVEYAAEYAFAHVDLPYRIPARERVLYVLQDPAIYSARMFDFPDWDPPVEYDFDPIIETIRII